MPMFKRILFVVFLLLSSCVSIKNKLYVNDRCYKGYIFPKEHSVWGLAPEKNRYTPSLEDISKAEQILRDNIGSIKFPWDIGYGSPRLLRKYRRQYIGYIMKDGSKLLKVNLIYKRYFKGKDMYKELSKDLISFNSEGGWLWKVSINLKTKKVLNIEVDGMLL